MPKGTLSGVLQEISDPKEQQILERGVKYVDSIAQIIGLPSDQWGILEWETVAMVSISQMIRNEFDLGDSKKLGTEAFRRLQLKRDLANHTKNRQDVKDKIEFQSWIKMNRDEYQNKADAIRDLRANEKFAKYPDDTLRRWITAAVWGGEGVRGRPRKIDK